MGLIRDIFGIGKAVRDVAEVFVPNQTEVADHQHKERIANYSQFSEEFKANGQGWFDSIINGLNRLPRPIMALGTVGLFAYAMVDPISFSTRMEGLQLVPEPLWWLLGAVVSFYFGARELHYLRGRTATNVPKQAAVRPNSANAARDNLRAKQRQTDTPN